MEYRNLGNSGLKVSVLALGTMLIDKTPDENLVRAAFDQGINLIDTADAYGEKAQVEEIVGRQLKEVPRDEIVLATKVRFGYGAQGANKRGLSAKHMRHAIDGSLRRLDVEFIDLYQCHGWDPETPLEESVRTMGSLIDQGKVLYWGLSNMNEARTLRIINACDQLGVPRPISHQPEYSLLQPGLVENKTGQGGLREIGPQHGFGLIVYSLLLGGLLTGKYANGIPKGSRLDDKLPAWKERMLRPERIEAARKLGDIAGKVDVPLGHVALSWVIRQPAVTAAIMGASSAEQIKDNVRAVEREIPEEIWPRISEIRDAYKAETNW